MRADERALRTACVRIADWPVLCAVHAHPELRDRPVVVLERSGPREIVRAMSAAARASGIRVGMRRREAEACGVALHAIDVDLASEARRFEEVARSIESLTPRLELDVPGRLSFPTRGPARYFGGDAALVGRVHDTLTALLGADAAAVRVGIADGRFAARLAAREARSHADPDGRASFVVAPGESAAFLAPFPVAALGDPGFAELLERLGLVTLGDFANLAPPDVLARFGHDGVRCHDLARGVDATPLDLSTPPPDLVESFEFDPPAKRVDTAAFAAKALADRLLARLADRGLGCTRVRVEAETEHGEQLARVWRHEGALTPAALAERVRWQLDGWLAAVGPAAGVVEGDVRGQQDLAALADLELDSPTGALVLLRLVPEAVVPGRGRQLGFWGGDAAATDRADRALGRVQGMLGFDQVGTCVVQGGRTPAEQIAFIPWGEPREPRRPVQVGGEIAVWPGRIPAPAPGRVFDPPVRAELVAADGSAIRVNGRGEVGDDLAVLRCAALPDGGGRVVGWAGPWLHDVRWWDRQARRRRAVFQVLVAAAGPERGAVACLVAVERGRAALDAVYD